MIIPNEEVVSANLYRNELDKRLKLQAENARLKDALINLLAWANIQDHHSAQAVQVRNDATSALTRSGGAA